MPNPDPTTSRAERAPASNRDAALGPMIEELRENFHRALSLDVQGMSERLALSEAENQRLRAELRELRSAVTLLRQIASEHESRLQVFEEAAAAPRHGSDRS